MLNRLTVALGLVLSLGASTSAFADPFVWVLEGTADSGHWDLDDLTGLDYTLQVTVDSAVPDQNGFNDFGSWFNLSAEIEIESLGTRVLNDFAFIEQFTTATSDRLRVRGPNGGVETVLQIPVGTLGDPDFLSVWGPVQTLGLGTMFRITDPGVPSPAFELIDFDSPTSPITISTGLATTPVPEPTSLLLLSLGVGAITVTLRRGTARMIQ